MVVYGEVTWPKTANEGEPAAFAIKGTLHYCIDKLMWVPTEAIDELASESVRSVNVNTKNVKNSNSVPCIKMPFVPVKERTRAGHLVSTYAFIDSGSSATFCSKSFLNKVGLQSVTPIKLLRPEGIQMDSFMVTDVEVCDVDENNFITLPPVYVLDEIPVPSNDIIKKEDLQNWPHLSDIDIPDMGDAEIGLMIGNNVPQAMEPRLDGLYWDLQGLKGDFMRVLTVSK
ncbi:hypothetical protein Pmani_004013 [Petrolisthes manimaculis]|uniref:Uncharacterized protein n=2 Tax=Petrolisthes manimaculis TaxID=1843537 RepID=A0AAE1QFI9_9EUCA|nr:hypothetical protein Pmani_004013 [Petrolisthes manimaculis]